MPVQSSQIVEGQFLATGGAALFTSPTGVYTRLDKVLVSNTGTASATVTLNVVPSGGSAGTLNATTNAQAVLPGQSWSSPNEVGLVLNPGDILVGAASAVSTLVIFAAGTQIS